MKYIFTLLVVSLLCVPAFAQITITKNDMPGQNDTIRYSNAANNSAINYDTTGAGITWDFSIVKPQSQGLYEYKSALLINLVYLPFFGLTAYGLKVADSISLGIVTLRDIYSFYKNSNTKFVIEGTGISFNGVPTPQNYSDVDEVYQFPLDYTNRDSSTFAVTTDLGGVITYSQSGYRINEAEGWGTVITPYGTFNALKIKTTVLERDTITNSSIPFPVAFSRTTIEYKWLVNGEKIPVFQVSGNKTGNNFQPNQIRYRDKFIDSLNIKAPTADFIADKTTCTVYDTVTLTNLTQPNDTNDKWQWNITPNTFSYLNGTGTTSKNPVVKFNNKGKYSVRLTASNKGGTDVSFKPQYITVDFALGVESVTENLLKLYPNPVTDFLKVENARVGDRIELYDVNGRLVLQSKVEATQTELQLQAISKGIYFLKVGTVVSKILKY
jgi:PKD repeat protein